MRSYNLPIGLVTDRAGRDPITTVIHRRHRPLPHCQLQSNQPTVAAHLGPAGPRSPSGLVTTHRRQHDVYSHKRSQGRRASVAEEV